MVLILHPNRNSEHIRLFSEIGVKSSGLLMKLAILLLLLFLPLTSAYAQSCNPASVYYIVRDEKGAILSEAELKTVYDQLPKKISNATIVMSDVSFKPDKKSYYWPEEVDFPKGTKVPAILLSNAGECTLHLTEATLKYRGRTMHLIFNIDIARDQADRRQVVDSLSFQNGDFKLDLTKWDHAEDKMIPATYWKPMKP